MKLARIIGLFIFAFFMGQQLCGAESVIDTFAGLRSDSGGAAQARLSFPSGIAANASGNFYISDTGYNRIRKVDATGNISTIAGNGRRGYSGDGGPAVSASLDAPYGVVVDPAGNVYFSDSGNHAVRKISTDGNISTLAGIGIQGYSGDGGPSAAASMCYPCGIALDHSGNIYVAEKGNCIIRKIDTGGTISTIAGIGVAGYRGDNNPAVSAKLKWPCGVFVDSAGRVLIADTGNQAIRMIDGNGIITRVAGNAAKDFFGDGGPATSASLMNPHGVTADSSGNIYIADTHNQRVRKIDAATGNIETIAGGGGEFQSPEEIALDPSGNFLIADTSGNRIRKLDPAGGIETVAGIAATVETQADSTPLKAPNGVAFNPSGAVFIADRDDHRIISVDAAGAASTIAGVGEPGYSGDGLPAGSARLFSPSQVAAAPLSGELYIADSGNHRIRKIDGAGNISTAAGTGSPGFSGDEGPAASAALNTPRGLCLDGSGNLFVADTFNHRIRRVAPDGTITTIAGTGVPGFSGDGGQASSAQLNSPHGVDVDGTGNVYIADTINHRVRKIGTDGIISTVAGTGLAGFSGDGGASISASLNKPHFVKVGLDGSLYISDTYNYRVRRVDNDGKISTIAGSGKAGFGGDGGLATLARIGAPRGITIDFAGSLYIADAENGRVRKVSDGISSGGEDVQGSTPIAYGQDLIAAPDSVTAIELIATDANNLPLTYILDSTPQSGVLSGSPPSLSYSPNPGFQGTDSFTFHVTNGALDSHSATVQITVGRENRPPVANSGFLKVVEDTTASGRLSGSDPDGGPLTYSIFANPAKGIVTVTDPSTGDFIYTPLPNVNGPDSFCFRVNDGATDCIIPGTIMVDISAVEDPPVMLPIADVSIRENSSVNVVFWVSDADIPATSLVITASSSNQALLPDQSIIIGGLDAPSGRRTATITPAPFRNGSAAIAITACDALTCTGQTFGLTVSAVNYPPAVPDMAISTNEDAPVSGHLTGTDPDGDPLAFWISSNPAMGSVVVTDKSTGAFTYTPNPNASGTDSFGYRASDGKVSSNVGTISVQVRAVNDPPTISAIADIQTIEDTPSMPVSFQVSDQESNPESLTLWARSSNTSLLPIQNIILEGSGSARTVRIIPAPGRNGSALVTILVSDGTVSANRTFTATVLPVNDPPVAQNLTVSTNEDVAVTGRLPGLDTDGDPLGYWVSSQGTLGSVVITDNTTGAFIYTPNTNVNGTDTFTYRVSDGKISSNPGTVTVRIRPVNDLPVISVIPDIRILKNTPSLPVSFQVRDTESKSEDLAIWAASSYPTVIPHKNLVIEGSGGDRTLKIIPAPNKTGLAVITIFVGDGQATAKQSFTATVLSSNEKPTAHGETVTIKEHSPPVPIILSAYDAEDDPLTFRIDTPPSHGAVSIQGNMALYQPYPYYSGEDSFTFRACDGIRESDPATITVSITPVIDPPVSNAGPDQTVAGGQRVTLSGTNSFDPDKDLASYTWTQLSGAPVTLSDPAALRPRFTAPAVTTKGEAIIFELLVKDKTGLSSTSRCIINVTASNQVPIADAGPDQKVIGAQTVVLNGSKSSDPDGQVTKHFWTQVSGPKVNLSNPFSPKPRFTAPDPGPEGTCLVFTLNVWDSGGLIAGNTCMVNVVSDRLPPVASAGIDQTAIQGSFVLLDGTGSDDSGNGLMSYTWSQESGPPVTLSDPTAAQPVFTAPPVGPKGATLVFRLKIREAQGLQSQDTCTVRVTW